MKIIHVPEVTVSSKGEARQLRPYAIINSRT